MFSLHVGFLQGGNSNLNGGPYFLVSLSMALKVMTGSCDGSSSSITIGRYCLAKVGASSFRSVTFIYNVAVPVCAGIPIIYKERSGWLHVLQIWDNILQITYLHCIIIFDCFISEPVSNNESYS